MYSTNNDIMGDLYFRSKLEKLSRLKAATTRKEVEGLLAELPANYIPIELMVQIDEIIRD